MSILVASKSGFEGRLNEQQQAALEELKVKLATCEFAKELAAHPDGDRWLLRFLRASMKDKNGARVFQVEAAEARLMKTMEFRKKYGVEEITRLMAAGEVEKARPPKYDVYCKVLPYVIVNDPTTGDVTRFDRFGASISLLDIDVMTVDEWTLTVAYTCELFMHNMRVNSKLVGKEISTYTNIVDAAGISLSGIVSRRKMLQYMSDIGAEHYPETLGKTFLCSCPWYFDKIFSLVKPFIDKDTLGKLCLKSNKALDEIMELMPKSLILKEWGGDNELVLNKPMFN